MAMHNKERKHRKTSRWKMYNTMQCSQFHSHRTTQSAAGKGSVAFCKTYLLQHYHIIIYYNLFIQLSPGFFTQNNRTRPPFAILTPPPLRKRNFGSSSRNAAIRDGSRVKRVKQAPVTVGRDASCWGTCAASGRAAAGRGRAT